MSRYRVISYLILEYRVFLTSAVLCEVISVARRCGEHWARNLLFSIAGGSCMAFIIISYGLSKDDCPTLV